MSTVQFYRTQPFNSPPRNSAPEPQEVAGGGAGGGAGGPDVELAGTFVPPGGFFKVRLFKNGQPIGWLGRDGIWCKVVGNDNGGVPMRVIIDQGTYYFTEHNYGYLTYSGAPGWGNPCAINDWSYACEWKIIGKKLIAVGPNLPLSVYKEGDQLYANSSQDYTALEVEIKRV